MTRNQIIAKIAQIYAQIQILRKQLMQTKTLYQAAIESLGIDITPDDLVPDRVACAITVSTLINEIDPAFPKVAGTWTLYDILEHSPKFRRVTIPMPGTIIICATLPNHPIPGHVGIFGTDNKILSNDSATGKFMQNYTLQTWYDRWVTIGKYEIQLYQMIL